MKLVYILDHLPGALQQLQYSIHSAGRTDHAAQRPEHVLTAFGRQAMLVELLPRARQRGTPSGCSPDALQGLRSPTVPLEAPGSTDSLTHENGQQTLTDMVGEERAHERRGQRERT